MMYTYCIGKFAPFADLKGDIFKAVVDYMSLLLWVPDMHGTTNRVLAYPSDIQMKNCSLKYLMDLLAMTVWGYTRN